MWKAGQDDIRVRVRVRVSVRVGVRVRVSSLYAEGKPGRYHDP